MATYILSIFKLSRYQNAMCWLDMVVKRVKNIPYNWKRI